MLSPARPRAATARLFLRGMAVVYAIAFASLAVQVEGLYGSVGILPASEYLDFLSRRLGDGAWSQHPTLLWWLGGTDAVLVGLCWAGVAAAAALFTGILPTAAAAACWALYFSLFQVGRVFLSFQWDILLLEAGFLAVFVAPLRLRWRKEGDPEPSAIVVWMLRWLLFRLMFASGVVKLLSNDPSWWDLTALDYHYWTQPLPTWTAWVAWQLPDLFQRACVAAMFFIELVVPWAVFGPRRLRHAAFVLLVLLQVTIAATGNYTFFNLLTVVLCIPLLDDDSLAGALGRGGPEHAHAGVWPSERGRWRWLRSLRFALTAAAALPLAVAGGAMMVARVAGPDVLPRPVVQVVAAVQPYRLTSSYGLFAAMTKTRREIVIEGSLDGREWREYPFRWKPGPVTGIPHFVAPHQPRLDWQMWFAALGHWQRNPWLLRVQQRLLEGSAPVRALFASDPFGGEPPRHVRAMLYDYRFTDWRTWRETGAWWMRTPAGPYSPVQSK